MNKNIDVFCDGGSRGNPGEAGIGIQIKIRNSKSEIRNIEIAKYIGTATNNQTEYTAVIEALKWFTANDSQLTDDIEIKFYLDSQLVVEQLNGNYKIKNEGLKPLYAEVQTLISEINGKISFTHIRREKNSIADKLVNEAINKKIK